MTRPRAGRRRRPDGRRGRGRPPRPRPDEGQRGDRRGRDPGRLRRLLRLPDHAPGRAAGVDGPPHARSWAGSSSRPRASSGAINMALGAAATGARVMVSSSSPGISLMAEAMSYMAGSGTPMVLVNVMRAGPGLGGIGPSQSDYFQATKGHGHGDYRVPVLAPASIGEAMELMATAFELAERYRTPVMLVADGILGQAMEPVELRFRTPERRTFDWALTGAAGPAGSDRQVDRPRPGGPRAAQPGPPAQVPRDRPPRDPLGELAARRRRVRHRRLRHRRARRPQRHRQSPREGHQGRALPADHAVAVPRARAGPAQPATCTAS